MEQARRILARNDEICWLRSATTGEELHATVGVNLETESGGHTVRYPRRPDSKAMKIAEQMGGLNNRSTNLATSVLEFWILGRAM